MDKSYPIETCTFNEIKEIWSEELWPMRKSAIEPVSWMDMNGHICNEYADVRPHFWCIRDSQGKPIAVISGHETPPFGFRSRGLWVSVNYRRQGHATKLMQHLVTWATQLKYSQVWTLPRITSWSFYKSLGFQIIRKSEDYEFGPHYFASLPLSEKEISL